MGVELEMTGETRDDSLNDQIDDKTDFVEALALRANDVSNRSQASIVLKWEKKTWTISARGRWF